MLPNFRTKFQRDRWEAGENNVLRGKIRINKRTLRRMLRKPGLTVQLPYAQLQEAALPPPQPRPRSSGRSEPWSDAVMCACVRVYLLRVVSSLSLTVFKWKYRI